MFLDINIPLIIILASLGVIIILALIFLLIKFKGKNKQPKIKIDEEFMNNIIQFYGDKDNIANVSTDNGRLKVEVKDLDKVDLNNLKSLSTNGVFVTGNIIKTLFRHDSDVIMKEIKARL